MLAREKRQPRLLYDSPEYSIKKIPLNYQITIKLPHHESHRSIDRRLYTSPSYGIEFAHEVANETIDKYFAR